jgi:hypothetical protein
VSPDIFVEPEIFTDAAEMVADNLYGCCCPAIHHAQLFHDRNFWDDAPNEFFVALFKPDWEGRNDKWWDIGDRSSRFIALHLAAIIAKDGL